MYFVEEGRLRVVWQTDDGVARRRRLPARAATSSASGRCSSARPRAASVEAVTPATLLVLARADFRRLLDEPTPASAAVVKREVERYDFRFVARVPLDFAEELLPGRGGGRGTGRPRPGRRARPPAEERTSRSGPPRSGAQKRDPALPPRLAGRRDGLRRRLPGDGLPPLRPGGEPRAHPQARAHVDRRHEPAGIARGAEAARPARALGQGVEDAARRAAAAGDRATGKATTGSSSTTSTTSTCGSPTRRAASSLTARSSRRSGRATRRCSPTAEASRRRPVGEPKRRLDLAVLPPVQRTLVWAVAARAARRGAADGAARLHAGDRRRRPRRTATTGCSTCSCSGHGSRCSWRSRARRSSQRYLLSRAAVVIDGQTLDFLTGRLLALPMSYFQSRRTGDIQRRLPGMRQVREFVVQEGVQALTAAAHARRRGRVDVRLQPGCSRSSSSPPRRSTLG